MSNYYVNLAHVCPTLGGGVVLMVNNLGGTSNLEMLIVVKEAIRYLGN